MSTSALTAAANETIAAWETKGHIRFAILPARGEIAAPLSTPGRADQQKHPAIAINGSGEFVIAWAEGTGWGKGGDVVWQVFGKDGKAEAGNCGRQPGLPPPSMPAAFVRPDGTFAIIY